MAGAPQIKHHQETVRYILNSLFGAIRVIDLDKIGISHIDIPCRGNNSFPYPVGPKTNHI